MSREILSKIGIKPSTWKHIKKAAPLAGIIFGSAVILKNIQEYKLLLFKLQTQGTISDVEADRLAEKQGINRKEQIKQQILMKEKEKEALESTVLQKEWRNIRIPRAEEGDPRPVQALRRLAILEEERSKTDFAERAKKATKRLTPMMEEAKEYLATAHKYLDAFHNNHKKNAQVLSLQDQTLQAMHFSEFFRRHLQKGRKMMPKLEACLELGGLTDAQIKELKAIIEDIAKTNSECMRCMKYTWDEKDVYLNSLGKKK